MKTLHFILIYFSFYSLSSFGQFCEGPLGPNLFIGGDFGSGSANIVPVDPGLAPGYLYETNPPPDDGYYTISNNIGSWNFNWGWLEIGDNSPDPNGYMMVVNSSYDPGLFFEREITGLCSNTDYVFSIDVINLISSGGNGIKPNLTFLVNGVPLYGTGDIPENEEWVTHGFAYTTGPGETSVTIALRNNAEGGMGNDLAIDNITFSQCGPKAILPLQEEMADFESYCQGLTVHFDNLSYGTDSYYWDFGVAGTEIDISTQLAPTFTYPAPGDYQVMLIANPGSSCTDTTFMDLHLNEEIDAHFATPPLQCVTDNNFSFQGQGTFPATGASFYWDFGPFANPQFSSEQNPQNIVFNSDGYHEITYTVYYDQCETDHTDELLIAAIPTINFSISDELKCEPYHAQLINFSTATTTIYSEWQFGDGSNSFDTHPYHWYTDAGIYDVSLTIWTDDGCVDTLTLTKTNFIQVYPSPTAAFEVSPTEQDAYHADFYFTDLSIDAEEIVYHFGDGFSSTATNVWHNYQDQGVFHPYQIVTNEFGCTDIAYQQLTVIPLIPVMVPNAFTPDGDALNNVFKPVWYDENMPFEMWIFNRWGEEIFYANQPSASWDGTANGVLVEEDSYVWRIVYLDYETGLPVELVGHVLVLR